MFYWIYDIPTESLAALCAGVFVGISVLGCVFLRPLLCILVPSRPHTNDVVGYVLSSFCVFYGILLGLLAVAAYQNFSQVELNVTNESSALAALYYDVSAYPDPERGELRQLLRVYCRYVIDEAWPLQRKGIIPKGGIEKVVAFQQRLTQFEPKTKAQELLHAEALREFNKFVELRRLRLHSVTTGIPAVMWYVVIVGAIINIALVWLFELNFMPRLFLGAILAFFLGTMVCLIAAMDNPFRGEVSVSPEAFELVIELMDAQEKPSAP
jgi:hypothetical protein